MAKHKRVWNEKQYCNRKLIETLITELNDKSFMSNEQGTGIWNHRKR